MPCHRAGHVCGNSVQYDNYDGGGAEPGSQFGKRPRGKSCGGKPSGNYTSGNYTSGDYAYAYTAGDCHAYAYTAGN